MIRKPEMRWICLTAIVLAAVLAVGLTAVCLLCGQPRERPATGTDCISTEYAEYLFDDSYVHELDIQVPAVNWEYMVLHAAEEVYVLCDVVIDGETVKNVAIRPKGNSSLTAISCLDSDRFSYKIEFDHYRADNTYHGLDKLALNNLGQDVSCMKDYLAYHMMNEAGVAAPLSSYVQVKLNGKDFGLYLAVEAVEDSFAFRNYGADYGNIYKPECFAVDAVAAGFAGSGGEDGEASLQVYESLGPGDRADLLGSSVYGMFQSSFAEEMDVAALKYLGDDLRLYDLIFDSSVFGVDRAGKASYVEAVKTLNTSDDPLSAVDVDSALRYLVAHSFVNNYDGYTGIFVHNYYLRESGGRLSMIPWDYNLAFGIFTLGTASESFLPRDSGYYVEIDNGGAMSDEMSMVNYPIDTPTFTVELEDRPLLAALLTDEDALALYHQYYADFLESFFESGAFEDLFDTAWNNIRPYIEDGQTFYTTRQAEKGARAIRQYCLLRAQSIRGQLDGTIPSTAQGQRESYETLVDPGDLNLADSVTFDGILAGLRSQDVLEILDAVAGDEYEHSMDGVTQAMGDAQADRGKLVGIAARVLASSKLLQRLLSSVVHPVLLLVLSAIVLLAAVRRAGRYRRRRVPEKSKRRRRDAVPT